MDQDVTTASNAEQTPRVAERRSLTPREVLYGIVGVLVGVLILGGIWMRTGRAPAAPPTFTGVAPYDAPAFTLRSITGEQISLSDFRGKVVLLNFWATWCLPCREETPALEAAYQQLKDEGFVIIGIDLLATERPGEQGITDVHKFVTQYGVRYPIVLDETGRVAQDYAISPIPTSYFIDQQGRVRFIRVGTLSTSEVERMFRRLQIEQGIKHSQ